MATVASLRSEKSPAPAASRRQPSETGAQELAALRATLDQKLAALEAGLANPAQCESLESLVIDLARVATSEAEAAAAKACAEAQLEAQRQSAARAETQRALNTERDASLALQRNLEQARAALESERKIGAALRRDGDSAAAALQDERETAIRLRRRLEEAEAKTETERAACAALRRDVEDARSALHAAQHAGGELNQSVEQGQAALEHERATAAALRQSLDQAQLRIAAIEAATQKESHNLQQEFESRIAQERAAAVKLTAALVSLEQQLVTAKQAAERRGADLNAAQSLIEGLERQRTDLERAGNESAVRIGALGDERDALARELTAAREALGDARSQAGERARTIAQDMKQALLEANAKAAAAARDRDMIAEELELMRASLAAVQNESQAQLDEVREAAARRIADLEAALAGRDRRDAEGESQPVTPRRAPRHLAEAVPREDTTLAQPVSTRPPLTPAAPASSATPPGSPVRRASRQAFHDDLQVLIDGTPATLIDLSITGAQLISQAALKPNRMVRVQLPAEDTPITCKGKVVWARLEASSTSGLRYRAGVFFTGVDERAIERFLALHAGQNNE